MYIYAVYKNKEIYVGQSAEDGGTFRRMGEHVTNAYGGKIKDGAAELMRKYAVSGCRYALFTEKTRNTLYGIPRPIYGSFIGAGWDEHSGHLNFAEMCWSILAWKNNAYNSHNTMIGGTNSSDDLLVYNLKKTKIFEYIGSLIPNASTDVIKEYEKRAQFTVHFGDFLQGEMNKILHPELYGLNRALAFVISHGVLSDSKWWEDQIQKYFEKHNTFETIITQGKKSTAYRRMAKDLNDLAHHEVQTIVAKVNSRFKNEKVDGVGFYVNMPSLERAMEKLLSFLFDEHRAHLIKSVEDIFYKHNGKGMRLSERRSFRDAFKISRKDWIDGVDTGIKGKLSPPEWYQKLMEEDLYDLLKKGEQSLDSPLHMALKAYSFDVFEKIVKSCVKDSQLTSNRGVVGFDLQSDGKNATVKFMRGYGRNETLMARVKAKYAQIGPLYDINTDWNNFYRMFITKLKANGVFPDPLRPFRPNTEEDEIVYGVIRGDYVAVANPRYEDNPIIYYFKKWTWNLIKDYGSSSELIDVYRY